MKGTEYFISGIDTDCGKTYVTGLLANKFKAEGTGIITSKLVQTGCKGIADDIVEHRRMMQMDLLPEDLSGLTCPYVLSYPASPHLAAEIDNVSIDINTIRSSVNSLLENYQIVLSEGAGGLMVPITNSYYTVDYIADYQLPLILVASSKLGSINHTLLSLELCRNYNVDLKLVIYNFLPGGDKVISNGTYTFLERTMKEKFPTVQLVHIKDFAQKPISEINAFKK